MLVNQLKNVKLTFFDYILLKELRLHALKSQVLF
jgi:hypothetical protein